MDISKLIHHGRALISAIDIVLKELSNIINRKTELFRISYFHIHIKKLLSEIDVTLMFAHRDHPRKIMQACRVLSSQRPLVFSPHLTAFQSF
jgi:hypothetical protein